MTPRESLWSKVARELNLECGLEQLDSRRDARSKPQCLPEAIRARIASSL